MSATYLRSSLGYLIGQRQDVDVSIVRTGGSLVPLTPAATRFRARPTLRLAHRVARTNRLGRQSLWSGYRQAGAERTPGQVGTRPSIGAFYRWLVRRTAPHVIVEFGTAFGYSGMHFLADLDPGEDRRLYTFEPNDEWRPIAAENLSSVDSRYTAVAGTFEGNLDTIGSQPIDLALIDAIHTSEFVLPQFDLVATRCRAGAIVLIDDIDFSDDMRSCWRSLVTDDRVVGAAEIDNHLGVLELA